MKAHRSPYRRDVAPEEVVAEPVVGVGVGVAPLVLHMPLRTGRRAPALASLDPWRAKDPMKR